MNLYQEMLETARKGHRTHIVNGDVLADEQLRIELTGLGFGLRSEENSKNVRIYWTHARNSNNLPKLSGMPNAQDLHQISSYMRGAWVDGMSGRPARRRKQRSKKQQ